MELSSPSSDLIGRNDAALLTRLDAVSTPLSGRELARLAGQLTHTTAQRSLNRFVEIGLVRRIRIGSAFAYELNREHVYWAGLELLLASRRRIDETIRSIVSRHPVASSVAVFGSYARNEATSASDLDIVVVFTDDAEEVMKERCLDDLLRLDRIIGNPVQVLPVSMSVLDDMVDAGDALIDSWLDDARMVSGTDLKGRIRRRRRAERPNHHHDPG